MDDQQNRDSLLFVDKVQQKHRSNIEQTNQHVLTFSFLKNLLQNSNLGYHAEFYLYSLKILHLEIFQTLKAQKLIIQTILHQSSSQAQIQIYQLSGLLLLFQSHFHSFFMADFLTITTVQFYYKYLLQSNLERYQKYHQLYKLAVYYIHTPQSNQKHLQVHHQETQDAYHYRFRHHHDSQAQYFFNLQGLLSVLKVSVLNVYFLCEYKVQGNQDNFYHKGIQNPFNADHFQLFFFFQHVLMRFTYPQCLNYNFPQIINKYKYTINSMYHEHQIQNVQKLIVAFSNSVYEQNGRCIYLNICQCSSGKMFRSKLFYAFNEIKIHGLKGQRPDKTHQSTIQFINYEYKIIELIFQFLQFCLTIKLTIFRIYINMSKGIIVLSQSEDQASDCCIINDKSRKTQSKTYYFPKWQQNIKNKQIQVQSQQPCFIRFKYCTNLNSEQSYVSASQVAPWLTQSTSSIDSPLLRFHNQIIDFFQYIKPSQQTKQKRTTAFNEIKKIILQLFPKVQVYPFGSFVTGLYLPDADIDVAVLTKKNYMADKLYDKLYLVLKKNPFLFTSLQYIKQARVPIIKFVYAKANIHFDICIDNQNGFKQLQYINKLNQAYPQFKYLYLVFKCFLKLRNLSNTYRGGIGGFLLFCLIHIYLQQQNRQSQCHCTLGEHILNFMNFFGENDWSWKVVYVKNAIIQVRAKQPGTFSCISPQDECRDIGKVSFKCIEIFKIFANRYKVLMQKSFEQGQSVLATILNPSHKQFPYGKQKTK